MQKRTETTNREVREEADRKMTYWRVVSHLSLNHLSLTDPVKGRDALAEYLSLYDFSDDQHPELREVARQVRDGVLSIDSRRDVAFVPGEPVGGYARGIGVLLELDEEKFVGIGSYLFAAVMDRFFAAAVTLNSFTRLSHGTRQRGPVCQWPPRAGDRPLV
ncbi:Protein ImpG/VasA [Fimbriiglobus ruber]|uniref:Protein ImpG/VasA n=2 Tax=Fimbriiglobus ruber TaxID=1908690 RepID=A0A225E550_9BACT|nr:Protein ImpG/VasA [Fimbriiglobus ruber]